MSLTTGLSWTSNAGLQSTTTKFLSIAATDILQTEGYTRELSKGLTDYISPGHDQYYDLKEVALKAGNLFMKRDLYDIYLNRPGNIFYFSVFCCLTVFNIAVAFRSRQVWFSVCFIIGFILETLGYLGRILGFFDNENWGYYILHCSCSIVAPIFIMAGIYFLCAQIVVVHGRQYSFLKPMSYPYLFISAHILSAMFQGGGRVCVESLDELFGLGNTLMFVASLIQILAMSFFLGFWFTFLGQTFFLDREAVPEKCDYKKRGVSNYFKMLSNVTSARTHKLVHLDGFYNPQYVNIRFCSRYSYFSLAISLAVVLFYIRCVYKVVEMKQGDGGYLMSHEIFLFVLDSPFIAAVGLIFVPFHPLFVYGREKILSLKDVKNYQKLTTRGDPRVNEDTENKEDTEGCSSAEEFN